MHCVEKTAYANRGTSSHLNGIACVSFTLHVCLLSRYRQPNRKVETLIFTMQHIRGLTTGSILCQEFVNTVDKICTAESQPVFKSSQILLSFQWLFESQQISKRNV
jgi:hypothetical protein